MLNNNYLFWLLISACLVVGFITGWTLKNTSSENNSFVNNGTILKVHDTIKTSSVEYKIIPGAVYNVDSIVDALNQSWKDSLKGLYGKGTFETKFTKEDNIGKREITIASRIPVDPEAELTFDEQLKLPEVYPKRTFGILAGLSYEIKNGLAGSVGLKYYVFDFRSFSLTGNLEGMYFLSDRSWHPVAKLETSLSF